MTKNFAPRRVLVVDDEWLIRWSIAEAMTHRGYSVVEAEDGAAALEALQDPSRPVAAIVLDYRLPDTRDLSLLARIREIAPKSPVILMTAHGTPEIVEGARRLGAYEVMKKPFELNELESLLTRACDSEDATRSC